MIPKPRNAQHPRPALPQPEASHTPQNENAPFETAAQAWIWATEVLRRRRSPTKSPAWRDDIGMTANQRRMLQTELKHQELAEIEAEAAAAWQRGGIPRLPTSGPECYALAQRVQAAVMGLPPEQTQLLMHWTWGDWAEEGRLRAAIALQEKARRQGLTVRLSYRYSAQQIGQLLGCSKIHAWRRINIALKQVERVLHDEGIVARLKIPSAPKSLSMRDVKVVAFKPKRLA
ncbi:MAG: hypothetical protein ACK5YK_01445 [Pseudomonadota bacterium]|jgi:DNA-directed RNA polymerase specialized sigma24 family protein